MALTKLADLHQHARDHGFDSWIQDQVLVSIISGIPTGRSSRISHARAGAVARCAARARCVRAPPGACLRFGSPFVRTGGLVTAHAICIPVCDRCGTSRHHVIRHRCSILAPCWRFDEWRRPRPTAEPHDQCRHGALQCAAHLRWVHL
eukprot:COSAG02_NODE_73_length_41919_cov_6.571066_12_plen_148_part_00